MHPRFFLAAALPVAFAIPAPAPAPVAAPAPVPIAAPNPQSQGNRISNPFLGLLGSLIQGGANIGSIVNAPAAIVSDLAQVLDSANAVTAAIGNGTITGTDVPAVIQKLFQSVKPTSAPTSIEDAIKKAAAAHGIKDRNTPPPQQNILENALRLVLSGFSTGEVSAAAAGGNPLTNGINNMNRPVPVRKAFYNKVRGDARFTLPESRLQAAMYIPPSFTWGVRQPIVMSPGTGATGAVNFENNIGKLLSQQKIADPVYLNIPNGLLDDAQLSSEYVSYALQYLKAQTNKDPAIVTWSQGSLNAQWAFKYWPSIRKIVTDHIAISPDYHGTILAYLLCPGFDLGNSVACVPSVFQQEYNSKFVTKLRSSGGDSSFVPTTTVYSTTDEIVQPQIGTAASGFIMNANGAGASNTFLQGACGGQPAGGPYPHEGVLYNPVAYALVVDALQHKGPGSFDRVKGQCGALSAPGLTLSDIIATEALIPLAVINIFSYLPKTFAEPALMGYATY